MQTAQEEIHPEIGEQHAQEGQEHEPMERPRATQRGEQTGMQGEGVDQHRDERPHLLGIPAPITSPAFICPHTTQKIAYGEYYELHCKRSIVYDSEFLLYEVDFMSVLAGSNYHQ